MNLDQARRSLSDGFRVSLKGKELTTKNGKYFMGGKPYQASAADSTSMEWVLVSSGEKLPQEEDIDTDLLGEGTTIDNSGKKVDVAVKKVAAKKVAAKKHSSHK